MKKKTKAKAATRKKTHRAGVRSRKARPKAPSKAAVARVASAEKELGVRFPADYRRFMIEHNGATPDDAFFIFQRRKWRAMNWVSSLCPITSSRKDPGNLRGAEMMRRKHEEEGAPVPPGCIVIGYDASDNFILLFVKGKRKNQVWLRLLEDTDFDPEAKPNPEDGMFRLAPSFAKFLSSLCSEDEAEKRQKR